MDEEELSERRLPHWGVWLAAALVVAMLIGGAGFVAWALSPMGPSPQAEAALRSGDGVTFVRQGDWLVFHPTPPPGTALVPGTVYGVKTGFVIYPGARVDPRSYAPVARELAKRGFLVAIVPMGLNLPVVSPDRARDVMRAYPGIQAWAVGGHSLGGAMAARFVDRSPGGVGGLVLWAAYPPEGSRLADTTLPAVCVYGTADGLATPAKVDAAKRLMPRGVVVVPVDGGNHSQFGSYGTQPGDGEAVISAGEQRRQVVEATARLLFEVEAKGAGCST